MLMFFIYICPKLKIQIIMKKILLTAVIAAFGFVNTNAQATGFEAGVYAGIPTGDASDGTSFNLGLNVAYLWSVSEEFKAGLTAGYDHWMAKKVDGEKGKDVAFLPIAARAKYSFGQFFVGLDLGIALGLTSEKHSETFEGDTFSVELKNKGGFLYQPRVGYNTTSFDIYAFYKGISNKAEASINDAGEKFSMSETGNVGSIGIGFAYKF